MPVEPRRAKSSPMAPHQLPAIAASSEETRRKNDAELGSAALLRRIRALQMKGAGQ